MFVLLLACTDTDSGAVATLEPTATLDSESETALTASWTTDTPADAVIEYGGDDAYGKTVTGWSSEDGLQHMVVLAGLAAGFEWHWRAVSTGAEVEVSEDQLFLPTRAPAEIPELTVSGAFDGLVLAPLLGGGTFVAMYDGEGRVSWWRKVSDEQVTLSQARLSLDGRSVLAMGDDPAQEGPEVALLSYPVAGGDATVTPLGVAHHDFIELAEGGYATIQFDIRPYEGQDVQGDALVTVDGEGAITTVWSTWDERQPGNLDQYPIVEGVGPNWTHKNSLALHEGVYWLSSYQLQCLFLVDAGTRRLVGQVGGADGNVLLNGSDGFGPQHTPIPTEDGFLLFNNRPLDAMPLWSEAVEFTLDMGKREFARRSSYDAGRSVFTAAYGNVEPLPGGGQFIAWGSAGRLTVLDGDGAATWEAATPLGSAFGFAHPIAELSGVP